MRTVKVVASPVVIFLGAAMWLGLPGLAQATTPHHSGTKTESYNVVQIVEETKSEYKVIPASQMKAENKRIEDEYKGRLKNWRDERKIDPTTPRPIKATIKIMRLGFETQTVADEYKKKLEDKDAGNDDKNDKKK